MTARIASPGSVRTAGLYVRSASCASSGRPSVSVSTFRICRSSSKTSSARTGTVSTARIQRRITQRRISASDHHLQQRKHHFQKRQRKIKADKAAADLDGLRKRLLAAVPADRCGHLRQQSNGGCFEKRREYSAGQAGQLLQPVEKGQNGRKKRKRRQKAERTYQHAQAERQLRRLLFQKQADHAAKQRRRDQLSYRVHQNSNSVLTMSNSSAMRCTTIISTTTSAASEVMVACSSRPERTRT